MILSFGVLNMEPETQLKQKKLTLFTNLAGVVNNDTLSRFYRSKIVEMEEEIQGSHSRSPQICPYCGNSVAHCPELFTIRFLPKMKLSHKVHRGLIKAQQGCKLGKVQRKLVARYRNSSTQMVIKCLQCRKHLQVVGPPREALKREGIRKVISLKPESQGPQTTVTKRDREKARKKMKRKRHANKVLKDESMNFALYPPLEAPLVSSTPNQTHAGHHTVHPVNTSLGSATPVRGSHLSDSTTPSKAVASLLDDRPVSQTPTMSAKSVKKLKAKAMHGQLKKMLDRDRSQDSSSSLKNFLSSL